MAGHALRDVLISTEGIQKLAMRSGIEKPTIVRLPVNLDEFFRFIRKRVEAAGIVERRHFAHGGLSLHHRL